MSKVLVVEDSPTQRETISTLLQNYQFTVTAAKNGVEALEHIISDRPDAVILDIIMPHLNGYEVCRRLKGNPQTENIPIIMCSSKNTEIDRYWGMKQRADAYISKPFQPTELIKTVKYLLRGQQG